MAEPDLSLWSPGNSRALGIRKLTIHEGHPSMNIDISRVHPREPNPSIAACIPRLPHRSTQSSSLASPDKQRTENAISSGSPSAGLTALGLGQAGATAPGFGPLGQRGDGPGPGKPRFLADVLESFPAVAERHFLPAPPQGLPCRGLLPLCLPKGSSPEFARISSPPPFPASKSTTKNTYPLRKMNGKTAMSKPISNGLSIKPVAAASSPALGNLIIAAPSRQNSLRSNSISPCTRSSVAEEISLAELFRLISQLPICVVRRVGSDVDAQISSMIDAASRSKGPSAEENASPTVHFLSVGHQSAGQLLNWVQRNGLPLIFLNGDCIGGLSELKALEKSGFLAESLCPHQFELVVIGGGGNGGGNEVAEEAVEEAIRMDKRVALVELVRPAGGVPVQAKPGFRGQLAKEAANQAALMRTAIEEARSSGWTVEGDEGQRVSFWLDWQSIREAIERRVQAQRNRLNELFEKGKVQRISALAFQFSGFHEVTICPETEDSEQFEKIGLTRLSADRFLLAAKTEAKMLENVPGAREFCVSDITELFSLEHNPGKTLFCCCDESDDIELVALESAAILRALGNEVTVMSCTNYASKADKKMMPSATVKSYEPELILHVKERLAEKGVQFVKCVPTKFEKLREPEAGRAPLLRVYAMTQGSGPASSEKSGSTGDWTPFLEEFNTVILCAGKRAQPFQALGLDKIGVHLTDSNRMFQQSNSVPNIYTLGDAPNECTGAWSCLAARQLVRRMFEGELHSIDQWDLCHTLLLPPLEYSCCGLTEGEAERRYGAAAGLNVFRDAEVPVPTVQKAKMICLKHEQDRVIGLHIIGPNAHRQLEGYALAMQLGLTRAKMEAMNSCSSRRQ